ncbi:unnamed protein product [Sphagnum troendelagicum]|uniref:BRCT domain-containing protein n=1 Tax=Sphagnum troendelagicum TaxID=128251 RepID=A0ABP0UDT5_9BRYO
MIESRFDHAKDVVVRWHLGYSEGAKQQRIFECPEEEASTYLEAVDENSRYVDPDWLFDSMAVVGSFRSSFNDDHHHTIDDAAAASEISSSGEEDAAGDEDEDVLLVARPREVMPTTVDLISSKERERP